MWSLVEFAQANLPEVTSLDSAFQRFNNAFPHLLEELYTSIRLASTNELLLRRWHNAVETQLRKIREQDERAWELKTTTTKFPWLYLILSATFATLYLAIMRARVDDYAFVPAINLVAIIGVVAAAAFFGSA
uniref:Uncharacterized protein n=1 Tax=Globisporangium ultimum (strain ATCC 200006 / CBS 805.95 / DAOM BR144) TaxID=431595 RepID=K3X897_GLOUD